MPDTIEPPVAKCTDAWPETDPSLLEEGRPALPDFRCKRCRRFGAPG
jgi:hypothetical protein